MLTLETDRLILRDFTLTDWDGLNAILSDPLVTRFMHFSTWSEMQRRAWLTQIVQEARDSHPAAYNHAITLKSDRTLIGWLGIGGTTHPSDEYTREFGYALNRRFWGQGYMPEAVQAVFAYEFTVLGMRQIIADCETANTASARVMQKSGMTYEGTFYEPDLEGNWAKRHRYRISKQSRYEE